MCTIYIDYNFQPNNSVLLEHNLNGTIDTMDVHFILRNSSFTPPTSRTPQISLYMHIPEMMGLLPGFSLSEVCLIPESVVMRGGLATVFLSPVFHVDDWHLYFNTVSFISKVSVTPETYVGGRRNVD